MYGGPAAAAAPALVGLTRKTRSNPSAVAASIRAAVECARGVDRCLPVVHEGRVVAETFGVPWWMAKRRRDVFPGDVFWRPVGPGGKLAAFTTYDGIVAAFTAGQENDANWVKAPTTAPVANNYYDLWPVGGAPVAGTYPGAARTSVQWTDASTGALYTGGNASPSQKNVAWVTGNSTAGTPTLVIYDRVLTYEAGAFTAATLQAMTNSLAAQRYVTAGQSGLKVMITAQTVLGATAANMNALVYTDQGGNAAQSAPVAFANAIIVSAAAPTTTLGARVVYPSVTAATQSVGPYVPLLPGDSGVFKLESYTTSAANTGTLCFVLMQPLVTIPIQTAGQTVQIDQILQIPNLRRIFDGACLALQGFFPAANGTTVMGDLETVWG